MSNSITEQIVGGHDKTFADIISKINKGFDDVANCLIDSMKTKTGTINLSEVFECDENGLITIEPGETVTATVEMENDYSQYCKGDIGLSANSIYHFIEENYPYVVATNSDVFSTEVSIARSCSASFCVGSSYYYNSGANGYYYKALIVAVSLENNSQLRITLSTQGAGGTSNYNNGGVANAKKFYLGGIDLIYELSR